MTFWAGDLLRPRHLARFEGFRCTQLELFVRPPPHTASGKWCSSKLLLALWELQFQRFVPVLELGASLQASLDTLRAPFVSASWSSSPLMPSTCRIRLSFSCQRLISCFRDPPKPSFLQWSRPCLALGSTVHKLQLSAPPSYWFVLASLLSLSAFSRVIGVILLFLFCHWLPCTGAFGSPSQFLFPSAPVFGIVPQPPVHSYTNSSWHFEFEISVFWRHHFAQPLWSFLGLVWLTRLSCGPCELPNSSPSPCNQ